MEKSQGPTHDSLDRETINYIKYAFVLSFANNTTYHYRLKGYSIHLWKFPSKSEKLQVPLEPIVGKHVRIFKFKKVGKIKY